MRHIGTKLLNVIRNAERIRQIGTSSISRCTTYDAPGKTTATVLNTLNTETFCIVECDMNSFTMNNNMVVIGPMAAFSKSVFNWNVENASFINEDSLSLFLALEPKIELLVIGLERNYPRDEVDRIKNILKKADIPNEVLPVKKAIAVFNFASYEGRYVAAGFIPPVDESTTMLMNR